MKNVKLILHWYLELNPVRANIVNRPEEWKWSSYASNRYGEDDQLIKPHPLYLAIHKDKEKRINYYRGGFRQVLDASLINDLRSAVQTGPPLGNNKFKEEIEQLLGVKIGYAKKRSAAKKVFSL